MKKIFFLLLCSLFISMFPLSAYVSETAIIPEETAAPLDTSQIPVISID